MTNLLRDFPASVGASKAPGNARLSGHCAEFLFS
jgi:hypothetical protein